MTTKASRYTQSQNRPAFGYMSKCEVCGGFFDRHGRKVWTCEECRERQEGVKLPVLAHDEELLTPKEKLNGFMRKKKFQYSDRKVTQWQK